MPEGDNRFPKSMPHKTFLRVMDGIDATISVADLGTGEIMFLNNHLIDQLEQDYTGDKCYAALKGRQAMPAGGKLYVRTENVVLEDDDDRPFELLSGRYVKVDVRDTGIGMDEETQQ